MKKLLIICITALLASCSTNVDLEQQVDELYAKMSQEERIAQLRSMYMDELGGYGKVPSADSQWHRSFLSVRYAEAY